MKASKLIEKLEQYDEDTPVEIAIDGIITTPTKVEKIEGENVIEINNERN